jgi:hypothetical protein
MRLSPLASALLLALALAACSRSDADKLKHDTTAVGHDVAGDVKKAGDDPHLKEAGDQLKAAAQQTGDDLKKAGHDLSEHTKAAGDEARGAAENK